MAFLWDPELLCGDHIILRPQFPIRGSYQREDRVIATASRFWVPIVDGLLDGYRWRGEIADDAPEYRITAERCREQALDVFHHEHGGLVARNDPQVLPVQDMLLVRFELLSLLLRQARPADNGVRLTRRSSHEHPGFGCAHEPLHLRIDPPRRLRTQLQVETARLGFLGRGGASSEQV